MPIKCLLVAATTVFLAAAAQASVVSIKASGTIGSGYDYANVFGQGSDLGGKSFSQTISFDTNQGTYNNYGSSEYANSQYGATMVTTVNGASYTSELQYGNAQLIKNLSTYGQYNNYYDWYYYYSNYDQLYGSAGGYTNGRSQYVSGYQSVYSYDQAFTAGMSLTGTSSFSSNSSYNANAHANFNLYSITPEYYWGGEYWTNLANFQSSGNLLFELNVQDQRAARAADLPEPAGIALFMAGLAATAVVRRRKRI